MSTPPSELPGPPPAHPSRTPTQIAGQQTAPSSSIPIGPTGPTQTPAAGTRTNTLAIVSLVAGIGSFFAHIVPGLGGLTVALVAVITGFMARKQIRETGEQGMGLATAGIVIGIVHLGLIIIVVIGAIFAIFVFGVAFLAHSSR
ncbi:MAG: DUF4190 domain-containing protein [Candidatus Dormibacteraeota bacterium]|nr:DUF4190 domain-containing protein [Candidatus Dormibacteraeota bacterium]